MSPRRSPSEPAPGRSALRAHVLRLLLAGAVGVAAALLVSCGSSSGKLIPVADAGPLQSDFEAIAQEAETGNGNCAATEAAIAKAEQDFTALPASVDAGLRNTLRQGIDNLRSRALALCAQPLVQTTTTRTTPKTTTSTTTTAPTVTTTSTPASTAPATTPTTPSTGGGTPAPGATEAPAGAGGEQGGGTGVGEAGSSPGGAGAGASQEGGK